jgi:hypothetical protein
MAMALAVFAGACPPPPVRETTPPEGITGAHLAARHVIGSPRPGMAEPGCAIAQFNVDIPQLQQLAFPAQQNHVLDIEAQHVAPPELEWFYEPNGTRHFDPVIMGCLYRSDDPEFNATVEKAFRAAANGTGGYYRTYSRQIELGVMSGDVAGSYQRIEINTIINGVFVFEAWNPTSD